MIEKATESRKWHECGRKKSYFTAGHARHYMKKIPDSVLLHVYECLHCFCFHVGHKPGAKEMKAAFKDVQPLKNKNKYVK